jgi:hypothetical protein
MPKKREDAEYLYQRIPELYREHTAKEVAVMLSEDDNVVSPVTERAVYNVLNKIRQQRDEQDEHATLYKDKPWCDEDDACLRQWYEDGASISMIAQQVHRSVPSVHARIRTLKLANRKITAKQERSIRDTIQLSNKSLKEISYEMGLKYQTVKHVSDKLKQELGVTERHQSDISFWQSGSLAERLIRTALTKEYGDAVVHWSLNKVWSNGRGWQIDIPIEFDSGLKVAIEINHVRTHANRRNRDYAKRRFAESLGWVWVPIWFDGTELTRELVADALDTVHRIIDDLKRGDTGFYQFYISLVEEREKEYYYPEQPPYDPKEGVQFGQPWSEQDTDVVRENYGKVPMPELQKLLSSPRTPDAIKHKARQLGVTNGRKGNFLPTEDDIIRDVYPEGLVDEILTRLPGRSWDSIASRAFRLGVKRRDVWTPDEDDILWRVYPEDSRADIQAALPNRSWSAIISRASKLGIRRLKPF